MFSVNMLSSIDIVDLVDIVDAYALLQTDGTATEIALYGVFIIRTDATFTNGGLQTKPNSAEVRSQQMLQLIRNDKQTCRSFVRFHVVVVGRGS